MFSTLGLFRSVPCPDGSKCKRQGCLFSHTKDPPEQLLIVPSVETNPTSAPKVSNPSQSASLIPAKRPFELSASAGSSARDDAAREPPKQRLRTIATSRSVAPSTTTQANVSNPAIFILRHKWYPCADRRTRTQSQRCTISSCYSCPPGQYKLLDASEHIDYLPQAMLKNLYDHFVVLYEAIRPLHPTLPSEHALRQEEEIYKKSTKLTYRNVCIDILSNYHLSLLYTGSNQLHCGLEKTADPKLSLPFFRWYRRRNCCSHRIQERTRSVATDPDYCPATSHVEGDHEAVGIYRRHTSWRRRKQAPCKWTSKTVRTM